MNWCFLSLCTPPSTQAGLAMLWALVAAYSSLMVNATAAAAACSKGEAAASCHVAVDLSARTAGAQKTPLRSWQQRHGHTGAAVIEHDDCEPCRTGSLWS
eukprot:12862-Heterococcus_DN1.PRE.1